MWITKEGAVHRKHWNPVTKRWKWDEQMVEFVEEEVEGLETGRVGLNLPYFIPVDTLICMAWRSREPYSQTKVHVLPGREPNAKHLRWESEERGNDEVLLGEESWKPLTWKCGNVPCDRRYQISSHFSLKSPDGRITSGFWWDGCLWASCKKCGLVNLTDAAKYRREIRLQDRILDAANMLMSGHSPYDHFMEKDVQEDTSWNYYSKAAQFIKGTDLRRVVEPLVEEELWAILKRMKRKEDLVLGGPLKPLMEKVLSRYPEFADEEFRWEQLRLARIALVSTL